MTAQDSVNPSGPKEPSIWLYIIGGIAVLVLIAIIFWSINKSATTNAYRNYSLTEQLNANQNINNQRGVLGSIFSQLF